MIDRARCAHGGWVQDHESEVIRGERTEAGAARASRPSRRTGSAIVRDAATLPAGRVRSPGPLAEADIVLGEPILPEDETADEMIAAVRR
jgi:hypothetical protein